MEMNQKTTDYNNTINVCLLEDNRGDAILIKELLYDIQSKNYAIETYEKLADLKKRLIYNDYDVLLIDLNVPDSKGIDTFTKVKKMAPQKPIIILTGLSDDALASEVVSIGAEDYLMKQNLNSELLNKSINYSVERHKIKQVLLESEAQAVMLVESNPNAVIVVDDQNVIKFANKQSSKLFGKNTSELIGSNFESIEPVGDISEIRIKNTKRGDRIAQVSYGDILWDKKPAQIYTLTDITELRKNEIKYKHIVDKSLQGIVIFQKGKMQYINPAASKISGYEEEFLRKITLENLNKIIHPEDLRLFKTHLINADEKNEYSARSIIRILSKNSEIIWAETEISSLNYDSGKAIQVVFIDISKLFESQIRTENLNRLLRTIQSVNQLIVRTKDKELLLSKVCENFVEESGYEHAWISLCNKEFVFDKYYEYGYCSNSNHVKENISKGNTKCLLDAIKSDEIIFLPSDDRKEDCYLYDYKSDKELYITSLKHLDNTFGVICVLREKSYTDLSKEKSLVTEIAEDVALALETISLDERREVSERTLSNLISNLPGTAYRCQMDKYYTMDFLSAGVLELTGYLPSELINNQLCSYADIIYPEDIEYVQNSINEGIDNNTAFTLEYRILTKNGEIRWVWERGSVVYDFVNNKNVLEGIIHDITEHKKSQLDVKRLTTAVNSAANGMMLTDLDAEIIWVNPSFTKLTGYTFEEVKGKKTSVLRSGIHNDEFYNDLWSTVKSGKVWQSEVVNKRKDGSLYFEEMTITPIKDDHGNIANFIAVITDITDRLKAEGDRAKEYQIQKSLTDIYKTIISTDADIITIADNILKKALTITGATEGFVAEIDPDSSDLLVHTLSKAIPTNNNDLGDKVLRFYIGEKGKYNGLWGHALNTKEPFFTNEPEKHPEKSGVPNNHFKLENFLAVPILSNNQLLGEIAIANKENGFTEKEVEVLKRIGEFFGFAIQKQRAQNELIASEEKYRLLTENASDVIWKLDKKLNILYINTKGAAFFGYTPEEMIGTPYWKYVKRRDFFNVAKQLLRSFKNRNEFETVVFESKISTNRGIRIPVEIKVDVTFSDDGKIAGVQGVIRDITERKRSQIIEHRNRKIAETLYGISKSVASDEESIVDIALEKIVELTDSEGGIIFFLDRSEVKQKNKCSSSINDFIVHENLEEIKKSADKYWSVIIDDGRARISTHENENKYLKKLNWEVSYSLTMPLMSDDSLIAICVFGSSKTNYTEHDILTGSLLLNEMWQLIIRKRVEKKIIESEKRFRSLYENSTIGMYQLSPDGKFILANPALLHMLGYETLSAINLEFDVLEVYVDKNYRDKFKSIMKSEGIVHGFESQWKKADGTVIDVRESANAVYNEEDALLYYEGVAEDITDKKLSELFLISAKEKAEKMDRMKSEFLAQMSHEIRTPINSMLSFVSLIQEEVRGKIDDELQSSFGMIYSAGKRIIRTIELLLNMSEMQTGNYDHNPKNTDIHEEVLVSLTKDFKILAANKNLNLTYSYTPEHPKLWVDQYSVAQIFRHLIDNAIIYTKSGSININYSYDGNNVRVEVEDTGIGISKEYLENLFEPFSQEDRGYTRKFEGNGLGLALVKRYCDLNSAQIEVESAKGKGTKFTVIFNDDQITTKN